MNNKLFLGLDYSTQQLKSLIFNGSGKLIIEESVDYDSDLSHYGTTNGVIASGLGTVCSPSAMWIEATDLLFSRLVNLVDLSAIVSLSGSAQQHATIFWRMGASNILSSLDPERLLIDQVAEIFSRPLSPSWMDCSTTEECYKLEKLVGGKSNFQREFGSSLEKRFSGPQIMKAFTDDSSLDGRTEAITLVSNGMCSLLTGSIVGVDISDAAGTGLQRLGSFEWDQGICSAISSSLRDKLGSIVCSNSVAGFVSGYFVKRYRMSSSCRVVAFTGDNPSSVVGMRLQEQDLCLSMGTSDTLFACLSKPPKVVSEIPLFVFPHPLYPQTFVSLLCYKNGSKTRRRVCERYCAGDWNIFGKLLESTPAGNDRILGLFYEDVEITPPGIQGIYILDDYSKRVLTENDLDPPAIVRSLIEGQLMAKYCHFTAINSEDDTDRRSSISKLLVTGGASSNTAIVQIAADVFDIPVYTVDVSNSAALGSVCRAVITTEENEFSDEFIQKLTALKRSYEPKNHAIYKSGCPSFLTFLRDVCGKY